jgi:hypothetical protein
MYVGAYRVVARPQGHRNASTVCGGPSYAGAGCSFHSYTLSNLYAVSDRYALSNIYTVSYPNVVANAGARGYRYGGFIRHGDCHTDGGGHGDSGIYANACSYDGANGDGHQCCAFTYACPDSYPRCCGDSSAANADVYSAAASLDR